MVVDNTTADIVMYSESKTVKELQANNEQHFHSF